MLYKIDEPFKKADLENCDASRVKDMCFAGEHRISLKVLTPGFTLLQAPYFKPTCIEGSQAITYLDGNLFVGLYSDN